MTTSITTMATSLAMALTTKKLYVAAAILPFGILAVPAILLARAYLAKHAAEAPATAAG